MRAYVTVSTGVATEVAERIEAAAREERLTVASFTRKVLLDELSRRAVERTSRRDANHGDDADE